jgi:hypothetical protein
MNLNEWAVRWQVPYEAVQDLRRRFGTISTDPSPSEASPQSEAAVQTRIRLEASRKSGRLWRNNVGAYEPPEGGFVRYGLANDTAELNKVLKSSDLVGVMPVRITPQYVGYTIGQFYAREVKPADWVYTGTPREQAQLNFLELVASLGGNAAFATGEGTL